MVGERRNLRQRSRALAPSLVTAAAAAGSSEAPPTVRSVPADIKDEAGDRLQHIVCMLCYPAFEQALRAPHDAVCICGKQLRKGDMRGAPDAPQCILCNELRDHHSGTMHVGK
jgi:hypothetical protein